MNSLKSLPRRCVFPAKYEKVEVVESGSVENLFLLLILIEELQKAAENKNANLFVSKKNR